MLHKNDRQRDDRRRNEPARARRQAETRACSLGEAADAAPAMIWVADAEGAIVLVNRRWVDFVGFAPSHVDGEGWSASVHPDDYPAYREIWLRTVHDRSPLVREYRLRRHDGAWRWILDSAEPRFDADGRYLGHAGAAIDNTAQHEALEQLSLSDARFRSFAEAADDLYWAADAALGRIVFANSSLERVWGASRAALFSDFDAYFPTLVHPDDLPRVEAGIAELRSGLAHTLTYRVVRPLDGEVRVVEDHAFPIRDEGAVRLVGGIMRDVTEQVRAHEELERRVAERSAELEASNEKRRKAEAALVETQRLEAVGRLTRGLTHDFNNLLTVMVGALDMILRRPDQPDRVRRLSEAALAAGRRGEHLTRKLQNFSRRKPLKVEAVSIGDLLHEIEPVLRDAAGESMQITIQSEPGLGARLDRTQFETALLNLVINAVDAIAEVGSIQVRAERVRLGEDEPLELEPGDYVRVAVTDTGRGMAAEVAAHAFEPFFSTKRDSKGSGLGLAQVYGFARQSGGTAQILTGLGKGTTVSFYLPAAEAPAASEVGAAPAEPGPSLEGVRVLLVDDDVAVRATAESLLQDLGAEVVSAADGPAAISALERDSQVRLLMTDVVMPGMSGVELARAVRALRPDLRVLLSTGYASESVGVDVTGWPVLRKPYFIEDLDRAARRAMA